MKKLFGLILLLSVLLSGCVDEKSADQVQSQVKDTPEVANPNGNEVTLGDAEESDTIVYKNTEYGFDFILPVTWKDYLIVVDEWEGLAFSQAQPEEVIENGPMISIRHPQWTSENPRQDIPIMIFSIEQWDSLQQEKFHIGAAPIGPKELNRNEKYVFAIPARYNFAFSTGFEEVEQILKGKPLEINGD